MIVLSGPSGVGKDTVLDEFIKICPNVLLCVTATTRQPRANETDGVDYHFVTEQKFKQMIEDGDFLEYAEVHGNFYGTPKSWVVEQISQGNDVVLKIDVQGGIEVKRQMPDAVMAFLVPPSFEELERRLTSRLTETAADLEKRLSNARNEIEQIPFYEYIIDNDLVENAAEKLRSVIIAERSRIVQVGESGG